MTTDTSHNGWGMVENAHLLRFLDSLGSSVQQQRAQADGDGAFCALRQALRQNFSEKTLEKSYRQHDNNGLHKSSGWPKSFIDGDSSPLMGLGYPDRHNHFLKFLAGKMNNRAVSLAPKSDTTAVDVFLQNLKKERRYANPPFNILVSKLLLFIKRDSGRRVL